MRKYVSGTKWCIWRWTEVDTGYITRLHLIQTPFGSIMLHWLNHPDLEPYMHDHPVTFLSIILRGRYVERRNGVMKLRKWFNFIRASFSDRHTILAVEKGTLTLCFMGPKRRTWGFHLPDGWVSWQDYYAAKRAGKPV